MNRKAADSANEVLWNLRFIDAVKNARTATDLASKAEKSGYHRGRAYSLLNLAAAYFYQSKNDLALTHLTESMHWFSQNIHEKGYARSLLLKGNIYESFGNYEKTLALWLEALKVSKEIRDIESEGESCSQLGLIYSRLCNTDKALEFFQKGLKIREELGDENAVASSLNRIGMVLRQTRDYDKSLEYYSRSLAIREKNSQKTAIPWTLLGIGNTYEEMKKYPEALDHYERGMTGGDKRCTLQCLMGAGRVLSCLGEEKKAEERLLESLTMAQELKSLVLVAEAFGSLANHYEKFGKPEKALKSFKQQLKARESYHSTEVQSKLSNIEVAHAIEKSEQEKEIYRLKHVELKEAYDIIDEKNKDITASINYASRIQRAILPSTGEIRGLSSRLFILYLPKDIVSGDFYWFTQSGKKLVIAAGDCTGHGVPGALMSMLGISFLEEIVNNRKISDTGKILDEMRDEVQRALKQTGKRDEAKDGMDISICLIDQENYTVEYSGAYNSLYLIQNNELCEFHADRMPIGIFDHAGRHFTSQKIKYIPGDMIYLFSDGFADQFGGPHSKKYKYSNLKNFLLRIHDLPLVRQKHKLEKEFLDWKGDSPQIDDVLIMGLRL